MKLNPAPRIADKTDERPLSNALGHGAEHAGVIIFFFLAGWLLDRWLGTDPWMAVVFTVLGIVGQFARFWYAYDAEMRQHDEARIARLSAPGAASTTEESGS